MRRSAFLVATTLLAACLPLPHHERLSPAFGGTVSSEAGPLAGVPVRLEIDGEQKSATATDAQGRFALPSATRFDFFVWYGDPIYEWQLVIGPPAATVKWRGWALGWVSPGEQLECQLPAHGEATCRCVETFDEPGRAAQPCHDGNVEKRP